LKAESGFNYWQTKYQQYCRPFINGKLNTNIPNLVKLNCFNGVPVSCPRVITRSFIGDGGDDDETA